MDPKKRAKMIIRSERDDVHDIFNHDLSVPLPDDCKAIDSKQLAFQYHILNLRPNAEHASANRFESVKNLMKQSSEVVDVERDFYPYFRDNSGVLANYEHLQREMARSGGAKIAMVQSKAKETNKNEIVFESFPEPKRPKDGRLPKEMEGKSPGDLPHLENNKNAEADIYRNALPHKNDFSEEPSNDIYERNRGVFVAGTNKGKKKSKEFKQKNRVKYDRKEEQDIIAIKQSSVEDIIAIKQSSVAASADGKGSIFSSFPKPTTVTAIAGPAKPKPSPVRSPSTHRMPKPTVIDALGTVWLDDGDRERQGRENGGKMESGGFRSANQATGGGI